MNRFGLFVSCVTMLTATAVHADDGAKFYRLIQNTSSAVREHEFTQMLTAVLKGSRMGPGDGWFKPSQSRYGWAWLAERFDSDKNEKIERKEFPGNDPLFQRLDRNRDGAITADDVNWTESSPFFRQLGQTQQWLMQMDRSGDRRLSKAEWDELFAKLAQGKNYLDAEDVRALLFPPTAPRPSGGGGNDMPSKAILVKGLLDGELGSPCEGPKLGAAAPDFTLKTPEGTKSVTLSKLWKGKPVVLIFGSFT